MRPSGMIAVASHTGGVLLCALLVASCGGTGSGEGSADGSGEGSRPSISPTRTPTAEVPSSSGPTSAPTSALSAEEPTTEPTSEGSPPELPSPTRTTEGTERPEEPQTSLTSEPTETEQSEQSETGTAPETVTSSPDAQAPEAAPAEEQDVPAWVWWLVGALVLASLVVIPVVVRSRRRKSWDQDLAAAEGELVWLARELLPELRRTASREELAGGWTVSQARVSAAEDRLTVLESSGPDEPRRARARALRDASRETRGQMQRLLGPGPHDTWALDLDTIIVDLEKALRPAAVTSPA